MILLLNGVQDYSAVFGAGMEKLRHPTRPAHPQIQLTTLDMYIL